MGNVHQQRLRHRRRFRRRLLGAFFALLPMPGLAAPPTSRNLDAGWQFRLAPGDAHAKAHPQATRWRNASVPGSAQTDLLAAGLVADPFVRDNEAKIQWVGLSDWRYRTTFEVERATLARTHVELVFDGLDTFADVYLNNHKLLSADNMFRRWRAPAKALLHTGRNTLEVRLYSPIKRLQPWLLKQPYALPGEFDSVFGDEPEGKQTANYIRKAKYQYGWDWGPRIVTEGIWQPVRLESWDDLRVTDFHVAQTRIARDAAHVEAQFEIHADAGKPVHVDVAVVAPDGHEVGRYERDATVDPGDNRVDLPIRIADPKLWYPAGYGAPSMYTFRATVRDADGAFYRADHATGLRSVELRRRKDRWGRSFEFVVNGIPVFAKGANLIPFDSFPTRVDEARMRRILESARDAHMNMLRMWGGGHYQSDRFYEMADRLGIMIWQDFMFGGAIPPYDVAYRENTRQEAIEQVRRLRDHPSIVLWCGNNEVQTGWESWGDRLKFKKSIGGDERERIVTGMVNLFGNVLRDVVSRYDPQTPYWASSPGTDYDGPANVLDDGDYHYWNVWSGEARPVEEYLAVTPRFQSEYGLQSFPAMRTIRAFAAPGSEDGRNDRGEESSARGQHFDGSPAHSDRYGPRSGGKKDRADDFAARSASAALAPDDRDPESPVMRAHQKYDKGNGNQRLLKYIRREFGEPKDFAAFVYLSQVVQAEGIQLAAEHLRASRPQAMGSLYWQLNDVWPGASWSSIDYYGRWKALQFHARRFYAPRLVAALRRDGTTTVSLVSDRTEAQPVRWRMRVMDFAGKVVSEHVADAALAPLASTQVARYTDAQLLDGADPRQTFVVFELLDGGKTVSRNLVFFDQAKNLRLPVPKIDAQLQQGADGYTLKLHSDRLAREVWISFGDLDAELSDNAFDLLPGETRSVHVRSAAGLGALRRAQSIRELAGTLAGTAP